jgi:hypothetical protein
MRHWALYVVVVCGLLACSRFKDKVSKPAVYAVGNQTLCVAAMPDDEAQNLGYVLYHTERNTAGVDTYCVVTQALSHDTDVYKKYCKTIISDIAEHGDFQACEIRIYDSNEAFRLNEELLHAGHWLLTPAEEREVQEHLVATYKHHVYLDEEVDNTITYYQYLPDFHTDPEIFVPEVGAHG